MGPLGEVVIVSTCSSTRTPSIVASNEMPRGEVALAGDTGHCSLRSLGLGADSFVSNQGLRPWTPLAHQVACAGGAAAAASSAWRWLDQADSASAASGDAAV